MGCNGSKADGEDWNSEYAKALSMKKGAVLDELPEGHDALKGSFAQRRASKDLDSSNVLVRADEAQKATVDKEGRDIKKVNGYDVKQTLGKGAFGEVFLGKKDGETFAIKVLRKSALKRQRTGRSGSALDSVKEEIATMKKIAHPNCVHMFDVILDPAHDEIYLVLEFVDGGPSQKNDKDGNPIPLAERTIWSHMRHLCMGLEYLHMHQIVHRDIKPDNLLLTRNGKFEGDNGMLKICDFGTSALCEGDNGAQKTAGTPPFFSPELCSKETVGTYDNRVVDLWAVGVTVYLWVCGRLPFMAPTVMLLMEAIKGAEGVTRAPKEASAGLASVIEGLLTRDTETRLTLMALREHPWLTDNGKMVMPPQPVMHVEVSAEEIEQAFSNRAAMMAQSAAGPSHLGLATGYKADWKREGLSTIRKKCTKEEAEFYRSIAACGHLSNHIPVIYSVKSASEVEAAAREGSNAPQPSFRREKTRFFGIGTALGQAANSFTAIEAGAPAAAPAAAPAPEAETVAVVEEARESTLEEDFEIRMQDLAAGMTWPCAMAVAMGTRTALAHDFSPEHLEDLKPNLLDKMNEYDPSAATEAEKAAGGVNLLRYLSFLDDHSSTKQHGFRIDAARTIVEGEIDDLPLPSGLALETLKEETMVCKALATFLQNDAEVAKGFVVKLETLITALSRSAFFKTHALVRSSLLLFYDDVARLEKLELKMINFGFSYALPEGQSTDHLQPWDGTAENHEDGYLTGVKSLLSVMKKTCELIEAAPKTYSI